MSNLHHKRMQQIKNKIGYIEFAIYIPIGEIREGAWECLVPLNFYLLRLLGYYYVRGMTTFHFHNNNNT